MASARGAASARLAEARAERARAFTSLTELSADWFWETDAEHRITWLSGGGPVATFFGDTPTYGKRFWEIPGVEVDAGALDALRERLEQASCRSSTSRSRAPTSAARARCTSSPGRRATTTRRRLPRLPRRRPRRHRAAPRRARAAAGEGAPRARARRRQPRRVALRRRATGELSAGDGWVRFLGHETSPRVTRGAELIAHDPSRRPPRRARTLGARAEGRADRSTRSSSARAAQSGGWRWLHARGRVTERDADGARAAHVGHRSPTSTTRKRAEAALAERRAALPRRRRGLGRVRVGGRRRVALHLPLGARRGGARLPARRAARPQRAGRSCRSARSARCSEWFAEHGGEGRPFRDLVHRVDDASRAA